MMRTRIWVGLGVAVLAQSGLPAFDDGPFGALWTVTDPGKAVTTTVRDAYGRVRTAIDPDKGTTILLAFVTVALMLVSGVRWFHVLVPVLLGGVAFGFLIASSGYARDRVRAFMNPEGNPALTYQVDRSLDAFGAGGVRGTGFGAGSQKWNIPEVSTDFVCRPNGWIFGNRQKQATASITAIG